MYKKNLGKQLGEYPIVLYQRSQYIPTIYTPEIEHRYQKLPFLKGVTFSKAHHFGYPAVSFRGVSIYFWVAGCIMSGNVRLYCGNSYYGTLQREPRTLAFFINVTWSKPRKKNRNRQLIIHRQCRYIYIYIYT